MISSMENRHKLSYVSSNKFGGNFGRSDQQANRAKITKSFRSPFKQGFKQGFKLKALMGNKDHDRYRDAFGKSNHKIMIASHVNTKTAIMIIISQVTNYSLILARIEFCNFTCEITKLPRQPFRTSQCQDGDEVLKCRE